VREKKYGALKDVDREMIRERQKCMQNAKDEM
jgi:hypothetical protein